jgi:ABC-type sulfate transport system permease component
MAAAPRPGPRATRWQVWPSLCVAAVALLLAGYLLLVASNAAYLGWDDARYFLAHPRMWDRLWLTFWTATLSTALSLLVGIPAGYALSRLRFPLPHLTATLIDLPIMVPPAAAGVFLLGATRLPPVGPILAALGIELGHSTAGVILVQVVVTAAFCARLMKTAFDGVNPRFEQVSRSLGGSLAQTLARVTLPLAKRGVIASVVVVWARAAAEWEGLMLFVGGTEGRTDTMPFAVYLDWNGAMMGWVVSMSLVCVLMAIAAAGTARLLLGRSHVW